MTTIKIKVRTKAYRKKRSRKITFGEWEEQEVDYQEMKQEEEATKTNKMHKHWDHQKRVTKERVIGGHRMS